ncbi:hypothetical protein D3C78_1448840 [compost metagenome]
MLQLLREAIQLGVHIIQVSNEVIRLGGRIHFIGQGQVEIGRQLQVIQRHVDHLRRLLCRRLIVEAEQGLILGQGRLRQVRTQVEIEVRQIAQPLRLLSLLRYRLKTQVIVQRECFQLGDRLGGELFRR